MVKGTRVIEGVIFDLDDTLAYIKVDWERLRSRVRELYSRFNIALQFKPILQHIDEATTTLTQKCGRTRAKDVRSEALAIIEEFALEGARKAVPNEGASDLLRYCRNLGLKIGILSRNARKAVLTTIHRCNFGSFIDVVMAREDCAKYKPDPLPVLETAERLGVKTHNLVVIGDHPYDITSGREAGAITIGVLTGIPPREDLESAGADYIASNLGAIIPIISALTGVSAEIKEEGFDKSIPDYS
ncbi:MAG: HAD family hydrolase [Promethearchaeota archaeon]